MTGGDESSAESAATLFRSIDSLRRLRSQKSHLESVAASLHEMEKRLEAATAATNAAQSAKEEEERHLQTLQRELREAETHIARSDASRPIIRSLSRLSLGDSFRLRSLEDARSAFREELCRFVSSHTPSSLSAIIDAWRERERYLESQAEETLAAKLATQLELTTLRKQAGEEATPPDLSLLTQTVDRLRSELEATTATSSEAEEAQFAELLRRKQALEDSLREMELELERLPQARESKGDYHDKGGDRNKGDGTNNDSDHNKEDINNKKNTTSKRRRVETAPCELSGTALRVVC